MSIRTPGRPVPATPRATPSYRRSLLLVTASGALVPLAGLASAPILTQHLGVGGRGELGAALAPNSLIVGAVTLGLPDAVAYVVARRPDLCRAAVVRGLLFSVIAGAVAALGVVAAGPVLAAGDAELRLQIAFSALMAVPALMVGLLRGAAGGRQRWDLVAWERGVGTVLRLIGLVVLALGGRLTVFTALLVTLVTPVVAGLVYRDMARSPEPDHAVTQEESVRMSRTLLGFGGTVWLGGAATVLVSRAPQLMIVPMSGVDQLGLYVIAVTVSDIPWIVVQAVRDVVFGSSAAERNDERMLATSRVATAVAAANSVALGVTLPWWLGPLFGPGFFAAAPATWVLLISSVVAVPGLVAGAAVAAAGRPGLRSAAIAGGLVVNIVGLVVLVPAHGASGAAIATLLCTTTITVGCLWSARLIVGTAVSGFVLPGLEDLHRARRAIVDLRSAVGRGRRSADVNDRTEEQGG